jgi:hypothetical protein
VTKKIIRYRAGYKYQLADDYQLATSIKPKTDQVLPFVSLDVDGNLSICSGYAWDGTSGPVIDTDSNMRASLVHDALYQLMRARKLSRSKYKDKAVRLFRTICIEDGVLSPLAGVYYQVLKRLGNPSTDPKNAKDVKRAP